MNLNTVDGLIQTGLSHHQAGRLREAEFAFSQAVQLQPNHPRLSFFLGMIAHQTGRIAESEKWLTHAIAFDPAFAEPHFMLALIHQQRNDLAKAQTAYQQVLAKEPNHPKTLNNLGRILLDQKKLDEGMSLLRKAVTLAPMNAGAHLNLAYGFQLLGQTEAALAEYKRTIEIQPNMAEAHSNLGSALAEARRYAEAIPSLQRAITLRPTYAMAHYNLAKALNELNRLEEAVAHCQKAVELRADYADAFALLGNLIGLSGDMPQAIQFHRKAVELKPSDAGLHSNVLLSLHYLPDSTPQLLFDEHLKWATQHGTGIQLPAVHPGMTAGRKLRIGYISPNFNQHSVTYFFEPVLLAHHRNAVEVFCYADLLKRDSTTDRIAKAADGFRDITRKSAADVCKIIQEDHVDVLVDLAGHTGDNRMPVFAMKPAPVQMTWLGYPNTTGLKTIDYRITDAIVDPPGDADRFHSEKLIRLVGGCWAYSAPSDAPAIAPLPALKNGFITFGSFNNLPKLTFETIALWANILNAIPKSRLLIKAQGLGNNAARQRILSAFATRNVSASQIDLRGWSPTPQSHLQLYNEIDIAFDTFPYNGTTTTCEALWMGVPVISLVGKTHVSRVGASLAHHSGIEAYLAKDLGEYQKKAIELARDLIGLSQVRSHLRDRFANSPVCDAVRLTRQLESAYLAAFV